MSGFGTNVVRACRSLALLLTGGLMVHMSVSGQLWQYLNPGFSPYIGAAGGALVLVGCLAPFAPLGPRPALGLVPAAVFAVFLLLIGWSLARPLVAPDPDWAPATSDLFYPEPAGSDEPRLAWNGREYVKLNTAELLNLAQKDGAPERVAVQGMVLKAPGSDGREHVLLVRAQIICCLADALGVGFRLDGPDLEGFEPGQWVRVLGTLRTDAPLVRTGEAVWPGVVIVVLDEENVLAVEHMGAAQPPGLPYIFEVRGREPFAY